jgi:hypothetical protein
MSANSGSEQRATAEHPCKDGALDILLTDVFDVLSISSHVFVVFADRSSLSGRQDAVSSLLSDILHLLSLTRPCFLRSISIVACTYPRAIMILTNKSWGLFLCILSRPPAMSCICSSSSFSCSTTSDDVKTDFEASMIQALYHQMNLMISCKQAMSNRIRELR